jgi:hypothetical protein
MFSNEDKPLCGACAMFEPARHEPAHDVRYGYCKPHEDLEREKRGGVIGRMVDATTECFMVRWNGLDKRIAFQPKPEPRP